MKPLIGASGPSKDVAPSARPAAAGPVQRAVPVEAKTPAKQNAEALVKNLRQAVAPQSSSAPKGTFPGFIKGRAAPASPPPRPAQVVGKQPQSPTTALPLRSDQGPQQTQLRHLLRQPATPQVAPQAPRPNPVTSPAQSSSANRAAKTNSPSPQNRPATPPVKPAPTSPNAAPTTTAKALQPGLARTPANNGPTTAAKTTGLANQPYLVTSSAKSGPKASAQTPPPAPAANTGPTTAAQASAQTGLAAPTPKSSTPKSTAPANSVALPKSPATTSDKTAPVAQPSPSTATAKSGSTVKALSPQAAPGTTSDKTSPSTATAKSGSTVKALSPQAAQGTTSDKTSLGAATAKSGSTAKAQSPQAAPGTTSDPSSPVAQSSLGTATAKSGPTAKAQSPQPAQGTNSDKAAPASPELDKPLVSDKLAEEMPAPPLTATANSPRSELEQLQRTQDLSASKQPDERLQSREERPPVTEPLKPEVSPEADSNQRDRERSGSGGSQGGGQRQGSQRDEEQQEAEEAPESDSAQEILGQALSQSHFLVPEPTFSQSTFQGLAATSQRHQEEPQERPKPPSKPRRARLRPSSQQELLLEWVPLDLLEPLPPQCPRCRDWLNPQGDCHNCCQRRALELLPALRESGYPYRVRIQLCAVPVASVAVFRLRDFRPWNLSQVGPGGSP